MVTGDMLITPKHAYPQSRPYCWALGPFPRPASTWTSTWDDPICPFWSYPALLNLLLLPGPPSRKSHPVLQATLLGIIFGSSLSCSLHFKRPFLRLQVVLTTHSHFFLGSRTSKFCLDTRHPEQRLHFWASFVVAWATSRKCHSPSLLSCFLAGMLIHGWSSLFGPWGLTHKSQSNKTEEAGCWHPCYVMFHAFSKQISLKPCYFRLYHLSHLPHLVLGPSSLPESVWQPSQCSPFLQCAPHKSSSVIFPKQKSSLFSILFIYSMAPHYQQDQVHAPQPATQLSSFFDPSLLQVYPFPLWVSTLCANHPGRVAFPVKPYSVMPPPLEFPSFMCSCPNSTPSVLPCECLVCVTNFSKCFHSSNPRGSPIIVPILQIRKLRLKEGQWITQGVHSHDDWLIPTLLSSNSSLYIELRPLTSSPLPPNTLGQRTLEF